MRSMRAAVAVFYDKYPLVGPIVWALSVQYYITQIVVALDWATPFSLRFNTISDLGNTVCGPYGGKLVCSPLHNYMNASFLLLGLFMIVGSVLIYQEFQKTKVSLTGFVFMGLAGFGTLLVGLFPENTVSVLHITGAALPFVLGNLSMVLLGSTLKLPAWLRFYTVFSGIVGLTALVFFLNGHTGVLGKGGMERITAYPQSIWLTAFGLYMFRSRYLRRGA